MHFPNPILPHFPRCTVYTTHCHTSGDIAVVLVVQSAWMDEWIPESPLAARQASMWGAWPGLGPIVAAVAVVLLLLLLSCCCCCCHYSTTRSSPCFCSYCSLLWTLLVLSFSSKCMRRALQKFFLSFRISPVYLSVCWLLSAWLVAAGMGCLSDYFCMQLLAEFRGTCSWLRDATAANVLCLYFVYFHFCTYFCWLRPFAGNLFGVPCFHISKKLCCISLGA